MRLKKLAYELRDLGEKIGDELLISTLSGGLNENFGNAAFNQIGRASCRERV